ncbi:MAG: extracellular solute-binding protein [Eubacteriales bacterium]
MKRTVQTASLFLAFFILLSSLLACSDQTGQGAMVEKQNDIETTAIQSEETTRLLPDLPQRDFEGYTFRVITRGEWDVHWITKDIFAEELTGDPINDAVYNRNSKICEQYNFEITDIREFSDYTGAAQRSIVSNSDDYDMLAFTLTTMGSFSTAGYVVDLKTVPYIDLEKPWYDQSVNRSMSIAGRLYATTGELMIMDNDATWALLFNKKLAEELQVGSLYDAVKNGIWTIDMLYECVKKAPRDLDGNGTMDEADQWGILGEGFNTFVLCAGAGGRVVSKDENDLPYISINTPEFISAFEKAILINARYGDVCFYVSNYQGKYSNVWTECMDVMFSSGKVLFNLAGMNRVTLFRSMDTDFGIIPIPKGSETQKDYHCAVSCYNASCIMIPKTSANLERTGIIIEALSAESMYLLTPAYYEISLKTKYARDDESQEMLDIIFASTVYDLGNIFDWGGVFTLPSNLTESGSTDFASRYAKIEKAAVKAMEKTIEQYMEQS